MKKFCKLVCMVMAAVVCFTGCGQKEKTSEVTTPPTQQTETGKPQAVETEETPVQTGQPAALQTSEPDISQAGQGQEVTEISKQFKNGINNFSYKIFDQLENGENIFISPYSMAIAISMLDNGAEGESKKEIEQLFGIKDLENWNACVKYYMSLNKEEEAKLLTANSLWLSENEVFSDNAEEDFFLPVKQYYNAEKNQLNLASMDAVKQINQWVSDSTNGMIDSILKKPLGEEIPMALLNAVYFKGEWKETFDEKDTQKKKFYGYKTTEKDMMHQEDTEYKYIEKYGMKAIELPYANEKIAMDVFILNDAKDDENTNDDEKISEQERDINKVFRDLSAKEKSNLFAALSKAGKEEISVLELPKFDLEYGVEDISEALKQVGMKAPFEEGRNEFSNIASDIHVGNVLHKAKIEVNEKGTEASAVTAIMMECDGVALEKEKKEFIANQPFMFVIRDVENDVILFMGSMVD